MPALKHECEGAPPAPEWAGAIPTRFQRLWILGLADAGRRVRAMWTDRQSKIQTFFGPGITAEIESPSEREVHVYLTCDGR